MSSIIAHTPRYVDALRRNPSSKSTRKSNVPQCSQTESQQSSSSRRSLLLSAAAATLLATTTQPPLPASAAENVIDGQGSMTLISIEELDQLTQAQKQILEYNRRSQRQNNAPLQFPEFIKEGYNVIIIADNYSTSPEGLIYKDFIEGSGQFPQDGQQVTFDYTAFNESASTIDSSYKKGAPAQTRLGIQGLIPGFELGIKGMKPGGKRRIIVPPELGPPVGPSTFFSAKQYEVFDIELRAAKTCERKSVGMFSSVVCE